MKKLVGVLLCVPLVVWVVIRIVCYITFNIHCGGHMERAGMANSIDLARQEMEMVVKYADNNGMTSGYTSVFYNTPDEDVGFWYNNMKSSLEELRKVNPEASDLEKSNILMKLRESVVHHDKNSTGNTAPSGLEIFPHNVTYAWFGIFSLIICLVGVLLFASDMDL